MASKPSAADDAPSSETVSAQHSPYFPVEGGCGCRYIRYRMLTKPLVVHCCHCTWCQRESGSAFAINAMIEANRLVHLNGAEPVLFKNPSESGQGQIIARCPKCNVAVWSNYDGPLIRFVKVGTLDKPAACPPDIHIFTNSKQPWIKLPEGVKILEKTYENDERGKMWSKESIERFNVFMEKLRLWEEKKAREQKQVKATEHDNREVSRDKTDELASSSHESSQKTQSLEKGAKLTTATPADKADIDETTQKMAALQT